MGFMLMSSSLTSRLEYFASLLVLEVTNSTKVSYDSHSKMALCAIYIFLPFFKKKKLEAFPGTAKTKVLNNILIG